MTKAEIWDLLVAALGFERLHVLRIRPEQSIEQWINILCAAITKETPNV